MSEWTFRRDAIRCFRFVRCGIDAARGEVQLVYAFDDGPELVETLGIPGAPFAPEAVGDDGVQHALRLLHLLAGVSYYKAAVPERIAIESYHIDAHTAALLTTVYENGLGEFAHRNGLTLRGRIGFPHAASDQSPPHPGLPLQGRAASEPVPSPARRDDQASADHASSPDRSSRPAAAAAPDAKLPLLRAEGRDEDRSGRATSKHDVPARALVAIGGGKDSLVSIEALRTAGVVQTVAWIGASQLIRACADRTGLPTLNITRTLAPALFEYNRQGAWNGHIPVTAVNSAILTLAARLTGHDAVVFSNERSASYGSMIPGTGEVNHQWSKGWGFERGFAAELARRPGLPRYFSLLRPLSELAVAREFARIDHYDAHFSSCNRNFHLLGERPTARWCGVCPKCHFVFLALAPFMPKPRLLAIFGRNLLDEIGLAPGFDALIEYREHKPFECVGEGRESRAAFHALSHSPVWREDALVARFAAEIAPQLDPAGLALEPLLRAEGEHGIPPRLLERLGAAFRA